MQLPADFNKMAPLIPLYERGKPHAYVELTSDYYFCNMGKPSTLKEVREYIEEKFGVSCSIETVRQSVDRKVCKNCIFAPGTGPHSRANHLIKIGNFCTPELLSDRSA